MKKILLLILLPLQLIAQTSKEDIQRFEKEAKQVTIIRDNWGIPHIYGKTDADCVFGLLYAQCEDDFKRVESNYIEQLGRTSEVKGESSLYADLLMKLVVDSAGAVADYQKSPAWLKQLLIAFADGVNYYLYKHPETKPALLYHFKPWYPLMFTDGSINAISSGGVTANELRNFYSGDATPVAVIAQPYQDEKQIGSNGFAIAPSKSASGNAILYINPHVTFYFRPEVQMVSEAGLNVYGAVTWGQFFVYQGFNEHCGWMHTSSATDVSDAYIEKTQKKGDSLFYEYDKTLRPVKRETIIMKYKSGDAILSKSIPALFTHHGPIMAKRNGQLLSVKSYNRSMSSLIQSWQRTKSKGFEDYKKAMGLLSNTSNNTVFADDKGNIAYWHGNFMPRRDTAYDWSKPVDGSTSATEWKGLHTVDEVIHVYNPASGFIQNCNSTPFTVSGSSSPKRENYPAYMSPDEENFRALNAVRLLSNTNGFTIDKMISTGYDTHLTAFESLIPALIKAYQTLPANDATAIALKEAIGILKDWNLASSEPSIATTLAIEWAQKLMQKIQQSRPAGVRTGFIERVNFFASTAKPQDLLQPLQAVLKELQQKFGGWKIAWGEINRYQRLTGNVDETFDDKQPSIPVGRVSSTWGCLPSFNSRILPNTQKRYGYNGSSFICAIEFGKKVKAKSLLTGGESGHPESKHFGDQAEMYAKGEFKEVLFYKEDVLKHMEKTYHPGE